MPEPAPESTLSSAAAGRTAARGGAIRVLGYVVGTGVSLVSVALLFRALGVEDGGRYVTVLSLVTVAGGLTDAGLTIIGVREHATLHGAERTQMLRDLLGMRLVFTAVGVLGALLFALLAGYDRTLVLGTLIVGAALMAQQLQSALSVGLMGSLRLGWVTIADIARQVVTGLSTIVLALAGASLLPFFSVNVVGNVAALVLTAGVVGAAVPFRPAWHLRRWWSVLRVTASYAVATAVGALYLRLAMILVSLIAGAQQTGYFAASFRGVEVLLIVPQLLVGAVFPILAHAAQNDRARLAYAVGRVSEMLLILGVGVALLLGVGAPVAISVIAGPGFAPAEDVLRLHGVSLLFSFAAAGWGYAALSLHRHRGLLLANLGALVSAAVAVSVGASLDGAVGAAIGTIVAEAVLAGGLALTVHRAGLRTRYDRRTLLGVPASTGLALVVSLVPPALPSLARVVLAGVVYAGALLLLRAVPSEVRDLLKRGRTGVAA